MKLKPTYTFVSLYNSTISTALLKEILVILSKFNAVVETNELSEATIQEFQEYYANKHITNIPTATFTIPSTESKYNPLFTLYCSGSIYDKIRIAYETDNIEMKGLSLELSERFSKFTNPFIRFLVCHHTICICSLALLPLLLWCGFGYFVQNTLSQDLLASHSLFFTVIGLISLAFCWIMSMKIGNSVEVLLTPKIWFDDEKKSIPLKILSPTRKNFVTFIIFIAGVLVSKLIEYLINLL